MDGLDGRSVSDGVMREVGMMDYVGRRRCSCREKKKGKTKTKEEIFGCGEGHAGVRSERRRRI